MALHINFTLYIIHREALASKSLDTELKSVLQPAIKMVSNIKSLPLNTTLFANLCHEVGSEHQDLLFHTEKNMTG